MNCQSNAATGWSPRTFGAEQLHFPIVVHIKAVNPLYVTDLGVFANLGSLAEFPIARVCEYDDGSLFAVSGDDVQVAIVINVTKDRRFAVLSWPDSFGDRTRGFAVCILNQS